MRENSVLINWDDISFIHIQTTSIFNEIALVTLRWLFSGGVKHKHPSYILHDQPCSIRCLRVLSYQTLYHRYTLNWWEVVKCTKSTNLWGLANFILFHHPSSQISYPWALLHECQTPTLTHLIWNPLPSSLPLLTHTPPLPQMVLDVAEFSAGEVEVLQDDKRLTVKGTISQEVEDGVSSAHRTFHRTFSIPQSCREEDIDSALSNDGILTITVPKKVGGGDSTTSSLRGQVYNQNVYLILFSS